MAECITPQGAGRYDAVFGWEFRDPAPGSGTIAGGPRNELSGGNVVVGPPTDFTRPVDDGAGGPAHVVWPPFAWDPPTRDRSGRTQWWTAREAVVDIAAGSTATYRLAGRSASLGVGAATQRCSQHVFVTRLWDGSPTPPSDLDKQTYELTITHVSNADEPTVLNTGSGTCRYLEYLTPSAFFAPFGEGFTTTETDRLNCWYDNRLPYSSDIGGFWVPRGTAYRVAESGLPAGYVTDAGLGDFTVDSARPAATYARCEYYPAFGSSAAVLDSDGSAIPEYGRAAGKWCNHLVTSPALSTDLSIAKALVGSLVAGSTATYEITVTNDGPVDDPGPIEVTDELPAGLSFASSDSTVFGCTAGTPVTCTAPGPLPVGDSLLLTIDVAVDADLAGSIENRVAVTGGTTESDVSDNVATAVASVQTAPTTSTTTTTTIPTTTTATTPAPATTAAATTIAPVTELPATGGRTSSNVALVATVLLVCGVFALGLARRRA